MKKPELRDFGITPEQYKIHTLGKKNFDISSLVPKYIAIAVYVLVSVILGYVIVLGCVFVIGALSAGTGGVGLAAFCVVALVALVWRLGRKISDWCRSRADQREMKLALANRMALQIEQYEEANAAYLKAEALRREAELARQEAERVAQRERQEAERIAEQAEQARRRKLYGHWMSLSGTEFEYQLAALYQDLGYTVHLTPTSGDDGIDLILQMDESLAVVQCKSHKRPVGPAIARELYGSMVAFGADDAILACTGGFTQGVRDFVRGKPITLVSASELAEMGRRIDIIQEEQPKTRETLSGEPRCPESDCNSDMTRVVRKNREFWRCARYPRCRGVLPICPGKRL